MPTLQDVAKRAGVSTATVSKVLSNTPYFTEATRQKVMQAVEEVGYVPNLAARALTTGKTQIIGVVFPYIYETIFEDALVMSVLKGIEGACWERNYSILVSSPRIDEAIDMQFQMLVHSGYFDGLICLDSIDGTSFAEFARENGVPNVVIGYHDAPYIVRCDDLVGSREVMEYVLEQGHRDFGIITITDDNHLGINKRKEGLFAACQQIGIDTTKIPISYGAYSIQSGIDAAKTLIEANPTLTAIISMNDRMAIGAIQYLQRIGKRVPEDVSVVGFDNIELSQLITPSLTTVDQRPVEQGRIAAQILFDVLDGKSSESAILDTKLIIRESSAPIADR